MAQTHFNLEREYLINHYRSKPIIDGYLLTNDFGFWVYLSREEFDLLRHDKLGQNQALFSLLKDKGFIFAESNSEKLINEFRQKARYLFRGAYHHVIFLDNADLELIDINENMIKIANFASQTPSKEIILEFKGAVVDNFHIVKKFVDLFKAKTEKKIMYGVEANLGNANKDVLDFLIDNRFDVWVPLKNLDLSEEIYNSIKELQRRHNLNFYLDVFDEILGEEQKIIDFFVGNNFNSFFIRKTNEVSKDNFLDFWKRIMDLVYETNKKSRRVVIQELFSNILLRKITSINDVFYPELNSLCSGAVISGLAYNLKGEIYANEESYGIELFKIGNVNSNYNSVVLGEDSLALISTSIRGNASLEINPYKPYIGNCPVCNYLEYSNIIGKYPTERNRILTEMLDYIFERMLFDKDFLKFILPV